MEQVIDLSGVQESRFSLVPPGRYVLRLLRPPEVDYRDSRKRLKFMFEIAGIVDAPGATEEHLGTWVGQNAYFDTQGFIILRILAGLGVEIPEDRTQVRYIPEELVGRDMSALLTIRPWQQSERLNISLTAPIEYLGEQEVDAEADAFFGTDEEDPFS